MRSAYGLAAMWRRAISAATGSASRVTTFPPSARREAIESALMPVNVPISSTRIARVATMNASRSRASTSPPAICGTGIVASVSARSEASAASGGDVCSIA